MVELPETTGRLLEGWAAAGLTDIPTRLYNVGVLSTVFLLSMPLKEMSLVSVSPSLSVLCVNRDVESTLVRGAQAHTYALNSSHKNISWRRHNELPLGTNATTRQEPRPGTYGFEAECRFLRDARPLSNR